MPKEVKSLVNDGEKEEDLLHGKLKIIQKIEGYRFSVDPLLLTNFVQINEGESVIDLGTGSAVMPLILSERSKAKKIVGLEIQKEMIDMAGRSIKLNRLNKKIEIVECDIRKVKDKYATETFDVVISNPPYIPVKNGKINPQEEKAIARHEIMANLEDVVLAAKHLLIPNGNLFLVYPANRAVDLLQTLRTNGLEPKQIKFVHSNDNSAAKLTLVKAVKNGNPELKVLKPLYIYTLEGDYTDEASAILENGKDAL
jgi:tRNA1Val (adenine37-N6)-methyltransferase